MLTEHARALNPREFEEQDSASIFGGLVPAVAATAEEAAGVFNGLVASYDQSPGEAPHQSETFYKEVDELMRGSASARRIADLASMARWELNRKRAALSQLKASDDRWALLSEAGSARRRTLKSAIALETALCEHEGLQSRLHVLFASELDVSVEIRHVYGSFRRSLGGEPPDEPSVQAKLRGAAVAIAKLIGRDVYDNLRLTDRAQLRGLQANILGWLREGPASSPRRGLRLWQDLSAFAGLLVQINNRTELREHDVAVAREALLQAKAPNALASDELFARLKQLSGISDEIDGLLLARDRELASWRGPLENLVGIDVAQAPQKPAAAGADDHL